MGFILWVDTLLSRVQRAFWIVIAQLCTLGYDPLRPYRAWNWASSLESRHIVGFLTWRNNIAQENDLHFINKKKKRFIYYILVFKFQNFHPNFFLNQSSS